MVLLHKSITFFKQFSTSTTPSVSDWKTKQKLYQLSNEISSILLQRRNWITHVKPKLPKSTLTSPIFLQILKKTRKSPKTTLDFFNWAKTHLRFDPDLKSQCLVIELATESDLMEQAKTLLNPLIETYSASVIVESMYHWFESEDSLSISLSLVLECYSLKGYYQNSLKVFNLMKSLNLSVSLNGYNSLLDSLVKEKQFRLALCVYSVMIRNRVVSNELTMDLVAQILCEVGSYKSVVKLIETGVESCKIYTNLVECYSKNGEFGSMFSVITEMDDKGYELSFCSYGCILNDACRLRDADSIEKVLSLMEKRKFRTLDNDRIIERLCEMEKTYACELLFYRDGTERFRDSSYGYMLKALSRGKEKRTKEAIEVYRLICRKGITILDESCYIDFANSLCIDDDDDDNSSEELLIDVIRRGFVPCTQSLSEVLASMCKKRRWNQAEKLLDSVMEMEVYFDSFSCGLLMDRYCRTGKLEKAMKLHEKIKKMKGSLDVNGYNLVLDKLMMRQREMVEEAVGVFEYMKEMKLVNSKSFMIMIQGLCRVKEMKKAMRFHDEMLKLGLKPDLVSYKRLILGFK